MIDKFIENIFFGNNVLLFHSPESLTTEQYRVQDKYCSRNPFCAKIMKTEITLSGSINKIRKIYL